MKKQDKVTDLETAVGLVNDGDVVAIQGMGSQTVPVAFVRELIRSEKHALGAVSLIGGIAIDWLATAGTIDRFIGAAVTLEQFGMCTQYRRGVEAGRIRVTELSETALIARLTAAARGLPFLPTRGVIGTDLLTVPRDDLLLIDDPFGTAAKVVACRPLRPDVTIIHAQFADENGNIAASPTVRWPDIAIMPQAAQRIIVTVEEIVPTKVLRDHPERTILPGFVVDAVVRVPGGARPTSHFPTYSYDSKFMTAWAAASRDNESAREFMREVILAPDSFEEFLDRVDSIERRNVSV